MPNVSSPLGTSNSAVPLINATQLSQAAGLNIFFASLAALNTAVTQERANITASSGIYADGQPFTVSGEAGAVRYWSVSGQHARNVILPGGRVPITLAADTNVVRQASGTPTGGSDGDLTFDAVAGSYRVRASGAWPTAGKSMGSNSLRVVYASSVTPSDADVSMGSTTYGTDATAAIQALLDLATSSSPLEVVIDGQFSVVGLRVGANTTVRIPAGCGLISRVNANSPIIRNKNLTGTPSAIVDHDIVITGAGVLNGNGPNQTGTGGDVLGAIILGFYGVQNLEVSGPLKLRTSKTFGLRAANMKGVCNVDGPDVDQGTSPAINTDGIHFNGPCENIRVSNVSGNCGDDFVAINADDAWVSSSETYKPYGAIGNVTIENVTLRSALFGVRLLSGGSRIERATIRNIRGATTSYAVVLDCFDPTQTQASGNGNFGRISVDDVDVDSSYSSGGALNCAISVNAVFDQLSLTRVNRAYFQAAEMPTVLFGSRTAIKQCVIDGWTALGLSGNSAGMANQIKALTGATFTRLSIRHCTFDSQGVAVAGAPIQFQTGVSIGTFVMDACSGRGFIDYVDSQATITKIHATNKPMDVPTASWSFDSTLAESGNVVTATTNTGTQGTGRKLLPDLYAGNAVYQTTVSFTGSTFNNPVTAGIVARATNWQPWTTSTRQEYQTYIQISSGSSAGNDCVAVLKKTAGGTDAVVAATTNATGAFAVGVNYLLSTTWNGSALNVRCQRLTDGMYFTSAGTWSASAQDCLVATDSSIAAAPGQQWGVETYVPNAGDTSSMANTTQLPLAA